MNKNSVLRFVLCCTTAFGSLALTQPATAQTQAQIDSIEQQIKALQHQLGQVKADLATRDRALKAAQEQAKAAQEQSRGAQRAKGSDAIATTDPSRRGPSAAPAGRMPPGQFKVGALDRHAGRVRSA